MAVNGTAIAALGAGAILLMSSLHGWKISGTIQDLLTGVNPNTQANANPIDAGMTYEAAMNAGEGAAGNASNVVNYALQYRGGKYGWGQSGPPGTPVDCSGLVNYAVGKQFGLPIPGYANGNYSGHGPVTQQWYVWNGAATVPSNQMQAGDLVCFLTHMGIAINGVSMISALDTAQGVQVTSVAAGTPAGEGALMKIRRMNA